MKKIFALIILILFLFNTASAQGDLELFENWYEYLNVPEEFSTFPEIIYLVFIPFLAVMAIVFGVLTRVFKEFFNKRIKAILAFVFAFSILYLGPLTAVVSTLLQVGSVFSVVAFFVMFFVISAFFIFRETASSYGKAKEVYTKVQSYEKSTKDISNDIVKLVKEIGKLTERKDDILQKVSGEQVAISQMKDAIQKGQHWRDWERQMARHQTLLDNYNRDYMNIQGEINKLRNRIDDLRKKEREMKLKF